MTTLSFLVCPFRISSEFGEENSFRFHLDSLALSNIYFLGYFSTVISSCRRNLVNVLEFLKRPNACTLVSGTSDRVNLHDKFKNAIEAYLPGAIDELTLKAEEKAAEEKKPSFWESVTDSNAGAFRFSF